MIIKSSDDITKDHAFAAALEQLFAQHPIHESAHERHRAVRESALRKARAGGYRGRGGVLFDTYEHEQKYWRERVEENAREDWNVPSDEVVAFHVLIYG